MPKNSDKDAQNRSDKNLKKIQKQLEDIENQTTENKKSSETTLDSQDYFLVTENVLETSEIGGKTAQNLMETPEKDEKNEEVGVGPWDEDERGPKPDLRKPENSHYDAELIENGDRRNVVDHYRYWTREAIVNDLDTKRHPFHIAIENWQHDMNIGTVVRNANAFLAQEIHIIGKKRWNRRGAMVTDRYQHVRHHPTVEDFCQWADQEGITIIGIDNFPDSVPLETYNLPEKCVLVFGQEGPGLSEEVHDKAKDTLSISQFGSTRSINAGAAAAIAMHAWIRRHVFDQKIK